MPRVSPFQGLVFDAAATGPLDRVTAPPYDVISEDRRRELLASSPFSVVHLDLGDGPDDPAHPQSRYTQAGRYLSDWESSGVLLRTPPSYFGYEMAYEADGSAHQIRGLLAAMDLEPWGGSVVPHEEVMPGPVRDRLYLLRATHTHVSPVYGTIAGPCASLAGAMGEPGDDAARWEVTDEQGVRHRMWALEPGEDVAAALRDEPLLIADGHHRYTTALAYRDERRAEDGAGPWDRILTLIVDATTERLPVLPFHRVQIGGDAPPQGEPVADLDAALGALSDDGMRVAAVSREDDVMHYRVITLAGGPPVVRALHEGPLSDARPLRYVSDAGLADEAVRNGDARAAWFLPPTTPDRIRALADRGERFPEKSTYFWPKPRTGMVMMPLEPVGPAGPR
jgi:uncharacterized protein (DUF1015 family)